MLFTHRYGERFTSFILSKFCPAGPELAHGPTFVNKSSTVEEHSETTAQREQEEDVAALGAASQPQNGSSSHASLDVGDAAQSLKEEAQ